MYTKRIMIKLPLNSTLLGFAGFATRELKILEISGF